MNAHLTGVTVGKKNVPKSKDDNTPVETLTLNFRYKVKHGGKEWEGESERWVQLGEPTKLANLDAEMSIIEKYTGKPVSFRSPDGLRALVKLTEGELAKIPIEVRGDRDGREYMSLREIAQSDADIDAMFATTVGTSGAARSSNGGGRQRPPA